MCVDDLCGSGLVKDAEVICFSSLKDLRADSCYTDVSALVWKADYVQSFYDSLGEQANYEKKCWLVFA